MAKKNGSIGLKVIPPLIAILLSVAMSCYWLWRIPIFLGADEYLHADYIFCLYSKKKLIRQDESAKVPLAHSFSRYLLNASGAQLVKWHESEKVPANYGSKEFFRQLDLSAPQPSVDGCPVLIGTYPVGYYALTAIWLFLASGFSSSLTVLFFASRFFSILLFATGLTFSYLTLRELGISKWRASLSLLAIGLLPLVSFVSSTLQPHNLSFAAINACFFFALRWRRAAAPIYLIYLGLALALVSAAKYQFFFPTALAVLLMIVSKDVLRKSTVMTFFRHLAIVTMPSMFAAMIQLWVNHGGWEYPAHTSQPHKKLAFELATVQNLFLKSITTTLNSLYCYEGTCFKSFWRCIGCWFDIRLILFSAKFTHIICDVIEGASIIVSMLTIVSLLRIWYGLLRAVRKNHFHLAFHTAFSNPLLTCYFIFFLSIFGLALIFYGTFVLQGRHWFSLVLPVFWSAAVVAPRIFKKNWRDKWFLFATATLLSYSMVASYFAIKAINNRYYSIAVPSININSLIAIPAGTACHVDEINYITENPFYTWRTSPLKVPKNRPLYIEGWAFDYPMHKVASAVVIYVDGKAIWTTAVGLENTKAAVDRQDEAYRYSGFGQIIPTDKFRPGWHILKIKVVSNDRRLLYDTNSSFKFLIE